MALEVPPSNELMTSESAGRGSLEARLDLLLGEEIQVNPEFAQWFAAPALLGRAGTEILSGQTDPVVRFNIWDAGAPLLEACYAGENDLDVVLALADGSTARLLIEDKVWAPFQPDQALRYRKRADSWSPTAAAVLVAPRHRLDVANADGYFDKAWSIEELAQFLETQGLAASEPLKRRLRWRANVLRALCVPTVRTPPQDYPPAVEFSEFCVAWLLHEVPEAVPNRDSMRSKGGGWLQFLQPNGLVYKVKHGHVDLYLVKHGFVGGLAELKEVVLRGDGPYGFVADIDTGAEPNVVLRWRGSAMSTAAGLPPDKQPIIDGLEACARAARWVASGPSCLRSAD